ncbi:hypothetical protein [Streptomyces sp. WMMB 322]|uniref:hypothetical protein n=1 Tax=Streptomyces sp. WMMB 322 TaxID=1286821 RepID=UPI000823D962|nr:hypothetical protein [Streptomyces sp. WMMB 322]SCK12490.1 hypothetical protein H180DRAFT_00726 [Streptomyces sp. WMMB 322]
MSDSQNPGGTSGSRPAGDPGHARARKVSVARNEAKSRGSEAAEDPPDAEPDAERLRRRARFLRERNEAKELRDRVQPRRSRTARMRQAMRMRTFRW